MNISPAHQGARNAGSLSYLSTGSGRARIRVYTDTRPAAGAAITDQVLLTTILLDPTPGTMVSNDLHLAASTVGLILATGTPTWARISNANDDWFADCSCSAPGGSGELQLEVSALGTLLAGGGCALVSGVLA